MEMECADCSEVNIYVSTINSYFPLEHLRWWQCHYRKPEMFNGLYHGCKLPKVDLMSALVESAIDGTCILVET
jgi:hypothetical protein